MDHTADVANEVTPQRLTLSGGQVLSLEPVLVPLLLSETHLSTGRNRSLVMITRDNVRGLNVGVW